MGYYGRISREHIQPGTFPTGDFQILPKKLGEVGFIQRQMDQRGKNIYIYMTVHQKVGLAKRMSLLIGMVLNITQKRGSKYLR